MALYRNFAVENSGVQLLTLEEITLRIFLSDDDVEMGLDKSIKVVTERRIAKPKDENEADASSEKSKEEEDGEEKNEGSERKRKESDASLDSSDKSVKRWDDGQFAGHFC